MKKDARKNNKMKAFANTKDRVIIEVNKENMMDRLMEVLAMLDADPNNQAKYSMVFYDFSDDELFEFDKKMLEIIALRSKIRGRGYAVNFDDHVPLAS